MESMDHKPASTESGPETVIVFIHGFKGSSDSFEQFPKLVASSLALSHPTLIFSPIVAPAFETRGLLSEAVQVNLTWLKEQRKQQENGGNLILCGHSMGGLVCAELAAALRSTNEPVLGVIAFDTPFVGINPNVFKTQAETLLSYANQARGTLAALGVGFGLLSSFNKSTSSPPPEAATSSTTKSKSNESAVALPTSSSPAATTTAKSSWFNLAATAGIASVAAAAGTAYYHREELSNQWNWITSHLSFVAELWKTEELKTRIDRLTRGERFHCFYTLLPPLDEPTPRTFIVLPRTIELSKYFTSNLNTRAKDCIQAHVDMFSTKSDGYQTLGEETVNVIRGWLGEEQG